MNRLINKIRSAFADIQYMFSKIPEVLHTLRKAPEKKILRAKLHQMTDVVVDTYGDLALSIAKNVDFKLFEGIVTDVALLVAKYQEPLKEQGKILAREFQTVAMDSSVKQAKVSDALGKIIARIAKREGWDKWEVPSTAASRAEFEERKKQHKARYEEARRAEKEKREEYTKHIKSFYTEKMYRMERAMPESEFDKAKYDAHVATLVDQIIFD
jgi:hypothetical protein